MGPCMSLDRAVRTGNILVVRMHLWIRCGEQNKTQFCVRNSRFAASHQQWQLVKFLVERVANQSRRDQCSVEAARFAVRERQWEVVGFLLRTVADQRVREQCFKETMSFAATRGHLDGVAFLVQADAEKDFKDQCCVEAAKDALKERHWEAAVILAQSIANETLRDQCFIEASKYAKRVDQWEVVKILVQKIVDQQLRDECCIEAARSAVNEARWELFNHFVQNIIDQNLREKFCMDALSFAAKDKHWNIVRSLVLIVTDNTSRDRCFKTAITHAANQGNLEEVKFLVQSIVDQKVKDDCCLEAAKFSSSKGHLEVLKFLLRTVTDWIVRNECCLKAMKSAAPKGHVNVVTYLMQKITDEEVRDQCFMEGVELAAIFKQWDVVKSLVPAIADQKLRNQCCIEATKHAATVGDLEVVEFFVPTVTDQTKRDQCCIEAAKCAANKGHLHVVKFLIKSVENPNQKREIRRKLAHEACSLHDINLFSSVGVEPLLLFESNSVLKFVNSIVIVENKPAFLSETLSQMLPAKKTKLLCRCISQDNVALALSLIHNRLLSQEHVDQRDSTGATALMLAADTGQNEIIDNLLDMGASMHAVDEQGRTALSRACKAGHLRAVKSLLERGADASHQDKQGWTCEQLAERFNKSQVLRLLQNKSRLRESHQQLSGVMCRQDSQNDAELSEELHRLLTEAGFTEERAKAQQIMADWLEEVARVLVKDDRRMTGSYAEGWANSLVQVNGRTAADSDIDWTVLADEREFHLEGGCESHSDFDGDASTLQVKAGHAQVSVGAGSQPALTTTACGVRPAQDLCYAFRCCSSYCKDRIEKLLKNSRHKVHLVKATRPTTTNELRVSFSLHEKQIIRQLSTVQGQLFAIIKFIFKVLLPLTLDTPGLKTYHAKTLLFFMLEKHGRNPCCEVWQPQNLIARLKESLDTMLDFIDESHSLHECMPHFFMPDAPLYFKNADIGGDFDNTKARVRDRLSELRADIGIVAHHLKGHVSPLQSENFYFHPFTLLPLTATPSITQIRYAETNSKDYYFRFADGYSVVQKCMQGLHSESSNRDNLMKQISELKQLQWCKCAVLCMTAMAHLKFEEHLEAENIAKELLYHEVKTGFRQNDLQTTQFPTDYCSVVQLPEDSDWAWRFCLPCHFPPRFQYLPEFTQTLFTARLSQLRSSHLYVNFRCLSWSLQAELLRKHSLISYNDWLEELREERDLEELLTLAHYSDCAEHLKFCLRQMETIRDEKRIAMEKLDEEKIEIVREKLERL